MRARPGPRLLLAIPALVLGVALHPALAVDVSSLWDFHHPALSEARFREALAQAGPDDRLILTTQIARTYGLRGQFGEARRILAEIESGAEHGSPEVRVRWALEWGRTLASAAHDAQSETADNLLQARAQYLHAYDMARANGLDALAIDALHMMAFVDTKPAEQLGWDETALRLALSSRQADARRWEGALRNNIGYALHELGRYDEALAEFEQALALYQKRGDPEAIRAARWMVAWTLRALNRPDEALAIQLELETECEAAGSPDADVLEELEILYRQRGDGARADVYAARRRSLGG